MYLVHGIIKPTNTIFTVLIGASHGGIHIGNQTCTLYVIVRIAPSVDLARVTTFISWYEELRVWWQLLVMMDSGQQLVHVYILQHRHYGCCLFVGARRPKSSKFMLEPPWLCHFLKCCPLKVQQRQGWIQDFYEGKSSRYTKCARKICMQNFQPCQLFGEPHPFACVFNGCSYQGYTHIQSN